MNQRRLASIGVLIAFALLMWHMTSRPNQALMTAQNHRSPMQAKPTGASQALADVSASQQPKQSGETKKPEPALPTPTENPRAGTDFPPLAGAIPYPETLREEVEADPHETPKALLAFSVELSERMEAVAHSEMDPGTLFNELESCVLGQAHETTKAVRALCLLDAHRLATRDPRELSSRYNRVENRADIEVVRLARTQF